MKIVPADPSQLAELVNLFELDFSEDNLPAVRKLSLSLAKGACFTTEDRRAAISLDNDLMGYDRVISIHAESQAELKALLKHALRISTSQKLFLQAPPAESALESVALECGFEKSGELSVPSHNNSKNTLQLLSANTSCRD